MNVKKVRALVRRGFLAPFEGPFEKGFIVTERGKRHKKMPGALRKGLIYVTEKGQYDEPQRSKTIYDEEKEEYVTTYQSLSPREQKKLPTQFRAPSQLVKETGVTADYFNEVDPVAHAIVAEAPVEKIKEAMRAVKLYTERHESRPGMPVVTKANRRNVERINKLALRLRIMGAADVPFDRGVIIRIINELKLRVYGEIARRERWLLSEE